MTPVEKLEAAITKLEGLKKFSNGDSWSSVPVGGTRAYKDIEVVIRADNFPDGFDDRIAEIPDAGDARLIVTLHRTIDAQLRLLRGTADWIVEHHFPADLIPLGAEQVVDLAEAILGDLA